MNKKRIVFMISIVFLVIVIVTPKIIEHNIEGEVRNYLVKEKHIDLNNIAYLKAEIGKAPLLAVEVHFADDPGMRYFYKKEQGKIIQFNTAPPIGADVNGHYTYKYKEYSN